jgi:hypothetical protein
VMTRLERDAEPLFRSVIMVGDEQRPAGTMTSTESEPINGMPQNDARDILTAVRSAAAEVQAQRYKRAGAVVRKFSDRMTREARERKESSVQTM